MPRRPAVALVGCGRAGGSIGLALRRAGYPLAACWTRSAPLRRRELRLVGAPLAATVREAAGAGDLVVVAVPDDAIAAVAREVAAGIRPGALCVHTSGATPLSALAPVAQAGAATGVLHPLQTLPDPLRGARALRGAPVAVTCAPSHWPLLRRVAAAWGGRPFLLAEEQRTLYHAAAVFASNYAVASVWAGETILRGLGLPPGLLAPLVRSSLENVLELGPARAITGPAVRGDAGTLRRHLAALQDPALRAAYRSMARLVARLAALAGDGASRREAVGSSA